MGNILYGDLGSEHMVYTDKNSVSYIVQSLYGAARDMMAGYYYAERESCGVWYYVHKYNSRRGGYLTGTAEELTGKLSPAARFDALQFATKEEFERKQHLGTMNLDISGFAIERNTALHLLMKLFAAVRDQKTLYLVLSQENCSERDYMLRGLSVCRKLLSVLPMEYQKRLSFVSNTMPGEKSGLKFSVTVLPRKYQDIYMTENYKPFDEPVFDLSQQMTEPEGITPLTAYYADLICGKAPVKPVGELLERVTPGREFNIRIYENIYALYYYGQKAQIAEDPNKFWHYWRVIANKKAQRTYGALNFVLKRLPKSALELLRKKQEEEVQKKEQAQQQKEQAAQAVTEAENLLQSLFKQTVHVKQGMDQALTWRQYAYQAESAEAAAEHLDKAKTSAAETAASYAELTPLCEQVEAAVQSAETEPEYRGRTQSVRKQAQQYHALAQQYIAEADKAVQEIESIILQKRNAAAAQEQVRLAQTDLARANSIYTETVLPALKKAYDALHEVQQSGKTETADRKLFVLRGLREEIADHAEVICEYAQGAAGYLAEALSLDASAPNIPMLKRSADSVRDDASRAIVSLDEADRQIRVLREQAKAAAAELEAKRLAATQEAEAQLALEAALEAADLPAETVLNTELPAEAPQTAAEPEPIQNPAADPLHILHTAPLLTPEFRIFMAGRTAAAQSAPAEQPAENVQKTVRLGMPQSRSAQPTEEKAGQPDSAAQPAAAAQHPLTDIPLTREEILTLLGSISPLMFDINRKAITEAPVKKKKGLAGIRAARKTGVPGYRLYPNADFVKEQKYGKDLIEFDVQEQFWGRLYQNHPDRRDVEIRGQYDTAEDAKFFGTRDYIVLALNTWLRDLRLSTVQVYCKKGVTQKQFCKTDAEEAMFCWLLALLVFYHHEPSIATIAEVQKCFEQSVLESFFRGREERAKMCVFFALMHIGCMLQVNLLAESKDAKAETAKRFVAELALKKIMESELVGDVLRSAAKHGDYPYIRELMLKSLLD